MYFESLSAALAMNGHGGFVWGAYAVTAIVLGLLLAAPASRRKHVLREIAGEVRRGGIDRGDSGEGAANISSETQS